MKPKKPKEIREPPKKVFFSYPEGPTLEGTVLKEVGELYETEDHGDYYFVIQSIEYSDEDDKYVRFGYYRKKPGGKKFVWGSQTTFHTNKNFANKLIKKAQTKGIL